MEFRFFAIARGGVQAGDLVLVLVSHDAIQPLGRGARQRAGRPGDSDFPSDDLAQKLPVAGGVAPGLVGGQALGAEGDQRIQVGGRPVGQAVEDLLHQAGLFGENPAPQECALVQLHRRAVQFDGAQDRRFADRDKAALPRNTEQHGVHGLRIAKQAFGQTDAVQPDRAVAIGDFLDRAAMQGSVDRQRCVTFEVRRGGEVHVADDNGGPRVALQHAGLAADGEIRGQHQVGGAYRDADDIKGCFLGRDLDMGDHGAILLRQTGEVEGLHRFTLQMGGHRQNGAGGDNAAAADAGEEATPNRSGWQRWQREARRRGRSRAPAIADRHRERREARPG